MTVSDCVKIPAKSLLEAMQGDKKLPLGRLIFGQAQYAVLLWSLVVNQGATPPKDMTDFPRWSTFFALSFVLLKLFIQINLLKTTTTIHKLQSSCEKVKTTLQQ